MNVPLPEDYIDIHNHGGSPLPGVFKVENLMAHEGIMPDNRQGIAYTLGIHPWHITDINAENQLAFIENHCLHPNVIALGEAGFDKLKGPGLPVQGNMFRAQVTLSERICKPLFIHCVKAWDELLEARKATRAKQPWMVHGFHGKPALARQLTDKGMYISLWYSFALTSDSDSLLKSLPADRLFLETDGSDAGIATIYERVSNALGMNAGQLVKQIHANYRRLVQPEQAIDKPGNNI
ncbi:MAG: TatD family hydrolase [Bacteroidales bacterium]